MAESRKPIDATSINIRNDESEIVKKLKKIARSKELVKEYAQMIEERKQKEMEELVKDQQQFNNSCKQYIQSEVERENEVRLKKLVLR